MRCLKVLVVEDEPTNREVAEVMLRSNGHVITTCENGREALALLAVNRDFDVILMDVLMPELDGLSATRAIKADPRLADIPLVIVSAHASGADRASGCAAGADGYLTKPFKRAELIAALTEALVKAGSLSEFEGQELKATKKVAH